MATKEKETPTGEKEQQGRGGGRQGLHCMARDFYLKNPTPPGAAFIQEGNRERESFYSRGKPFTMDAAFSSLF